MSEEEYREMRQQIVQKASEALHRILWMINTLPILYYYQSGFIKGHTEATLYALETMYKQNKELHKALTDYKKLKGE